MEDRSGPTFELQKIMTLSKPIKRRTVIISVILVLLLTGVAITAVRALDYWEVVNTYWRVHDVVMQPTAAGRYYIALFWEHNYELCALTLEHPQVMNDGRTIIMEFEPGLRALAEGRGDEIVITAEMVDHVTAYLDLISGLGSPELAAAIHNEEAKFPFEQFKGMTFEQARILTIGLPEPGPIPTPIDWEFPRTPDPPPLSTGTP